MTRRRALAAVLWFAASAARAAEPAGTFVPNPAEVSQEASKTAQKDGLSIYAMWMPEAYWRVTSAGATDDFWESFLESLRPYNLLVVAAARETGAGRPDFLSEEDLARRLRLSDGGKVRFEPLPRASVNDAAKGVFALVKPVLVKQYGVIGENMHFFFFPADDKAGRRYADPALPGALVLTAFDLDLRWRLPFGSLSPPAACPTCREVFNGAYTFCPYDGAALAPRSPSSPAPSAP